MISLKGRCFLNMRVFGMVAGILACSGAAMGLPAAFGPKPEHNLQYTDPAMTWDEAFPLGNGLLGALLWGNGAPFNISLDRTDLWDLRPVPEFLSAECNYETLRAWWKEGKKDDIRRVYDLPYDRPQSPTKIPAGRIELPFAANAVFAKGTLDIKDAVADVSFSNGTKLRGFVHATSAVGMMQIRGGSVVEPKLVAPPFSRDAKTDGKLSVQANGKLSDLGYSAPVETYGDTWRAFTQEGQQGFGFAVYLGWRDKGSNRCLAWSVASTKESATPLDLAKSRVEVALDTGFDTMLKSHQAWWRAYWNKGTITLPNKRIERQWYLDQYKFGAAARHDAPPITLQGPWTADNNDLPPWKGDYHHDLNTQLSYWPCYSGNRLDEGLGYLNWLWDIRGNCEAWTQRFFQKPGLNVPGVSSFDGSPLGGWCMYSFSSTAGAWLAEHFYLHWRYSGDDVFLRERGYPYVKAVATFLEALTAEKGPDGKRTVPLSSSPEINDNRLTAWFDSPTNYDLALIRGLFQYAAEMAEAQGLHDEAARWRKALSEMPGFWYGPDGRLLIAKDYPLPESHRHFSHLMAIYPLSLIDFEDGPEAEKTIRAALAELDEKGTSLWCGYSFAWHACLAARAHDGVRAERALDIFAEAFVLRNGLHCNGDQTKKKYSTFTYRPMTLEGNFASAAAVQEMLLQSHRGKIRVFPAVPETWKDVSFTHLRAQGGFLVSALQSGGHVKQIEILAENGGKCVVISPFSGKEFELALKKGERVVWTKDPV